MQPGSSLAYILVDHALLLIPQDKHLAELMDRAAQAMERAGLTTEDLPNDLPAVRDQVVKEMYGTEFMEELAREHAAIRDARVGQDHDN